MNERLVEIVEEYRKHVATNEKPEHPSTWLKKSTLNEEDVDTIFDECRRIYIAGGPL